MATMIRTILLLVLFSSRTVGQVPEGQIRDPSFLLLIDRFIDSTSFYGFSDRLIIKTEISNLTFKDSVKLVDGPFSKVYETTNNLSYLVRLSLVQNSNEFQLDFPHSFFDYRGRRVYVFLEYGHLFDFAEQDRQRLIRDVKKHLGKEKPGNSIIAFMGGEVDGNIIATTWLVRN